MAHRALRGRPIVRRVGRLKHWTEAISGGRWSAAGFSGLAVAVVAGTSGAWLPAALGATLAVPTLYAAVAQLRRGRF
jgi:ABC-type amino acid transport substrate-binding protein